MNLGPIRKAVVSALVTGTAALAVAGADSHLSTPRCWPSSPPPPRPAGRSTE